CRRIGRDDLKARLIATFLTDVPVHVLEERALAYQNRFWETLMRPHALTAV
ncbi:HAD-IB family hydrolase, partial [Escherichia coli]|nr:HAD-IB family hydrolase [Escherichia coli]